jgi:CIC family chloride channel protein
MPVAGLVRWGRFHLQRFGSSEFTIGLPIAILVGLAAGLGAVAFRWLITFFQSLFFDGGGTALGFMGHYYVIVLPVAGGLIVGPLVYFLAQEARGPGVAEVMAAVSVRGGRIRPRVAAVKALASSICIGSGGSVGREGPIVQIGASLGSTIGQWLRMPEDMLKTLVACGAAGGISATFNAPIAGVFFALEVILGRVVTPRFGYVVLSSVVADVVAHTFIGTSRSFSVPLYSMVSAYEIGLYAALGVVGALVALAFILVLYRAEDLFGLVKLPVYVKPALGGLVVGLLGLYSADLFGVGYGGIETALAGEVGLGLLGILMVLKIVATSATLGSGGSGGVFAPSLFIGAMMGTAFGEAVNSVFPGITAPAGAYGMVGMAAVFAAAARAPVTSIIMLFEMTGDYAIILPVMTAVVISTTVARGFNQENIYTIRLLRQGIDIHREEVADVMRTITVGETMTRDFPTVPPSMSVQELLEQLNRSGHHGFPVTDAEGCLCGVVTLQDVERAPLKEEGAPTVGDIATEAAVVAFPDQSLYEVLMATAIEDYGRIPVVDRQNRQRLLGVLRRHDIIRAYRKRLTDQTRRG